MSITGKTRFPPPDKNTEAVKRLKQAWLPLRDAIDKRLDEFRKAGKIGSEEDIFAELVFCLFTPQSKARSCWSAVKTLRCKDLLLHGSASRIARELNTVRFRNNKSRYVILARKQFCRNGRISVKPFLSGFGNTRDAREWLAGNVKGMGYKEASHFLRNIGRGENISILDRHVLRNLAYAGVISRVPESLSRKTYLEIEDTMTEFAREVQIPLSHLDLLFWCRETGEIFK